MWQINQAAYQNCGLLLSEGWEPIAAYHNAVSDRDVLTLRRQVPDETDYEAEAAGLTEFGLEVKRATEGLRAQTLKEVGKWLDDVWADGKAAAIVARSSIEAFKKGRMPGR